MAACGVRAESAEHLQASRGPHAATARNLFALHKKEAPGRPDSRHLGAEEPDDRGALRRR